MDLIEQIYLHICNHIILYIYLSGVIISYLLLKLDGPKKDWGEVWISIILSLFSYFFILIFISVNYDKYKHHLNKLLNIPKPPKWL